MEKVLIVEDNQSMREMLESIVKENGFQVKTASDVSTAMCHLKKEQGIKGIISKATRLREKRGLPRSPIQMAGDI